MLEAVQPGYVFVIWWHGPDPFRVWRVPERDGLEIVRAQRAFQDPRMSCMILRSSEVRRLLFGLGAANGLVPGRDPDHRSM